MNIERLSNIFKAINMARESNLPNFDYSGNHDKFNKGLKEYLQIYFGNDINFDRDETFAYIQAHYKNVPIEINTFGGIILTVEDISKKDIAKDFEPIFKNILGVDMLCSYDFCTYDKEKTVYPTFEWNLNPDARLNDLVNNFVTMPNQHILNFKDYYNTSIINNLGNEVLSLDGYLKLFGKDNSSYMFNPYFSHKMRLIENIHPNIKSYMVYSWVETSRSRLSLIKKVG